MTDVLGTAQNFTESDDTRVQRYEIRTSRNLGFLSEEDQVRLAAATVAIAGVGGDGGEVAVQLARLGVRRFRLADPEVFELENTNRQAGCDRHSLGRNKAVVIAEEILAIDPDAEVITYTEGITAENTRSFVDGADLVIDETEFTHHELGVGLARAAREYGIPMLTGLNVGFGCVVTSFRPDGPTLEEHLGLRPEWSMERIRQSTVPLDRWVPRMPQYLDLAVIEDIAEGRRPAPSVAPGVLLAAGFVLTEAVNHLTRRRTPVASPRFVYCDGMERRVRVLHRKSLRGRLSFIGLLVRSKAGATRFEGRNGHRHIAWPRLSMMLAALLGVLAVGLVVRSNLVGGGMARFESEFRAPFWVFAVGWLLSLVPYWWGIGRLFVGLYQGSTRGVMIGGLVNRAGWFLPYGMVLAAGGTLPTRLIPWAILFVVAVTVAFAWRISRRRPPKLPDWVPTYVRRWLRYDEMDAIYLP